MAASLCQSRTALRAGAFGRPAAVRAPARVSLTISASFKNKENIDLSKVDSYKRHESDSGSTQLQIARLSARVQQMSRHCIANKKDYSSRRGLEAVLAQRKKLMQYLYKEDRSMYQRLCVELGIRSVVVGDTRKAELKAAAAEQ